MPFDGTQNETVAILLKMRDEIASGHWCKGRDDDGQGNRCIGGWWLHFNGTDSYDMVSNDQFFKLFGDNIISINDHKTTTKEMMVNLIDNIITAKG